ncbi:MAG: right-handed parallel beta-helix repeat-containing protein [bacterium]
MQIGVLVLGIGLADPSFAGIYVPEGQGTKAVSDTSKPKIDFARLSIPFIENKGQISNEDVLYYASCFFGNVWVTNDGNITYSLPSGTVSGVSIRETFPDRLNPRIEAKDQAETKINYFIGGSDNWKTNIPAYNEVSLGEVYPGINLSLKAYGNNVEKLFTLLPGALPERIKVRLEGCSCLSINKEGCLEIATEIGSIKMTRPIAYQDTTKGRDYIDVAYKTEGNTYGFTIGEYNQDLPLIIDPLLASTFLGGSGSDYGNSIAIGTSGDVFVTGFTASSNFPTTTGAYDTSYNGNDDAFISRLSPDLKTLVASTFLGGGNSDQSKSIAIGASGDVFVTGYTYSSNFPTTTGVTRNGNLDAFISRLTPDLSSLVASTFLGGSNHDYGYSIAIGTSGDVFVTGYTGSSDFPTTQDAYDTSYNGSNDVFISRLTPNLGSLVASTFLGGSNHDYGHSIAIGTSGDVFVTGYTASSNFPTTTGTSHNGSCDAFISRLSPDLSAFSVTGSVTVYPGGATYPTIQAGVDACPVGGTVSASAGTYPEAVYIDKRIALVGQGTPTIATSTIPVTFNSNDATGALIYGFMITGAVVAEGDDGAGIFCKGGAKPIIANNIIANNGDEGIRYDNASGGTITNNTISGSNDGILLYSSSSPSITNNTLTGNSNGICCDSSSLSITNNTISGNKERGINCNSSSPLIINNTISKNNNYGICNENGSPTITNNIITGNGDGIHCNNSSPIITNNTISENNNNGIGGWGISNTFSFSPFITNNIITKNKANGIYNDPNYSNSGTPTINYNCVWGNIMIDYFGCSAGPKDISANPQFIGEGDYHLGSSSPCIDKGSNTAPKIPLTDKDGKPRIYPIGGTVDIGAYEFQGTSTLGTITKIRIDNQAGQEIGTTNITTDGTLTLYLRGYCGTDTGTYLLGTWSISGDIGSLSSTYGTYTVFYPTTVGIGTISATDSAHTDTTGAITVTYGTPIAFSFQPSAFSLTADGSITFSAIAKDSDGNTWTVTTATFSEDDPVGTMTANIYYPGQVGTWTITGTYTNIIATATVFVLHGSATSLTITPATSTLTVGSQQTYTGTATDSDGNQWDETNIAWSTTDPKGTFTKNTYYPGTVGTWTITGTLSNLVATATVFVSLSIEYGTIIGRVLNILTKEPIQGATITINSVSTTTDLNGSYTITITLPTITIGSPFPLPTGPYTITVSSTSYYESKESFYLSSKITQKDFSLCPRKRNIPQDTWTMFSIPVMPDQIGASLTPEKLFERVPANFKICRWEPQAEDMGGSQMRYRVVDKIEPNKGYWLKVYGEQANILSKGEPQEDPVSIPLYTGWNMIGCPFTKPASINGSYTLWTWTGKGYVTSTGLSPWQGYWIQAKTDTTISIKIQNPKSKIQNLEENLDWKIKLYATSGKYEDNYNILGVAKDATLGVDRFDLSKPPAMEGLYCSFDGGLAKDIREEGADSYLWNLNIQSQAPTTLSWVIEGVPEDYEVWLIDGDKAIDMRKNSEFRIQNSELKIKIMKPNTGLVIEKLEITDLISYPNPTSGEVTFRANLLTSGAGLSARLYNILGQVVREQELTHTPSKSWARFDKNSQSYIYESGYSCLNNSNQRLANGLYFFQITASENGKSVSKIGRMVISK